MGKRQTDFTWDFACLRSPLFSLDEGWVGPDALQPGVSRDEARRWLAEKVHGELFESALACASSTLIHNLDSWSPTSSSEWGHQIERALMRYVARACRRSTPFGLFAGFTAVSTGDATSLELPDRAAYRAATTVAWPTALALDQGETRTAHGERSYIANATTHQVGGLLRYTQRLGEEYSVVDIEITPYLEAVLDRARGGATHRELLDVVLAADPELDEEDVLPFLETLIEKNLLQDVSGPSPCGSALGPPGVSFEASLGDWRPRFEQETARVAETLRCAPSHGLLSTVLRKPSDRLTLGPDVLCEATRTLELLRRFGEDRPRDSISEFRESFERRFGAREVPLLVAADPVYGVVPDRAPSSHPLLADLPEAGHGASTKRPLPTELQEWIDEIYAEVVRNGLDEVVLSPERLARLRREPVSLPPSFAMMFGLLEDADGGHVLAYPGAYGPSGGRLVGRFAQADESLAQQLRVHAGNEQQQFPGAVMAEVNFAPSGREGTIAVRPRVYPYEITLLDSSTADLDQQIPVNDLLISLDEDRFVLRSRRLGVQVVPRFSSAYNESLSSFPAAWLLIRLAAQEARSFAWRWGHHGNAPALPRIRCGRTILSPRQWNLFSSDLDPFERLPKSSSDPKGAGHALVQQLRARWGWPRYVLVGEGAEAPPVDLDNPLSVDGFIHAARKADRLCVSEDLFGAFPAAVRGPQGRFSNEVVLVGRKTSPPREQTMGAPRRAGRLTLGSNCLYVKLYARAAAQDRVLQTVATVLEDQAGKIERWFFVRYADPDSHLRVRFFGDLGLLTTEVLPALLSAVSPLLESDVVSNVQFDGYDPETARYGGPHGLSLAEQLFHVDSASYLKVLDAEEDDVGEDTRLQVCVAGIRDTMANLGWGIDEQIEFARGARDAFLREFAIASPKALAVTYRRYRPLVERALRDESGDVFDAQRWRRDGQASTCREIVAGVDSGEIRQSLRDVAWPIIHMFVNRVMPEYPRRSELVAYDAVLRGLTTMRARNRNRTGG